MVIFTGNEMNCCIYYSGTLIKNNNNNKKKHILRNVANKKENKNIRNIKI